VVERRGIEPLTSTLEGLKETGGRFLDFDLTTAMIEGKTLTLHLEDGRRLDGPAP